MWTRLRDGAVVWGLVATLAACGGGGGEAQPPAPPPPVAAAPVIGVAGGTVNEPGGATVVVPAGALETATTIRVAMDSTGAPPLPAGLAAAGNTFVVTPHGGDFAQPVEVRIPAPNVSLLPNQQLKLAKAQPGGAWEVLGDSVLRDGALVAQVNSFSFFIPVTVTYLLPLAQAVPYAVTSTRLDCEGQNCQRLVGEVQATFTVVTNNGQLPANCPNAIFRMGSGTTASSLGGTGAANLPLAGGSVTRTVSQASGGLSLVAGLYCAGPQSHYLLLSSASVRRASQPSYPFLGILVVPAQLDVVAGLPATLDAVLNGGPSKFVADLTWAAPTPTNRAEIDWQRSDDGGRSWRVVARSYQDEAEARPLGSSYAWRTWSVRHGFIASAADQGAFIRVHACYTPPDVAAPPCVTGPATRLNVLQQSALPALVEAPRSVLVRTGQTASFSATAGGAPAPTLQWQTRAANAVGAWTDASNGSGAATGSYTTPTLSTADNGTQFRVVASNALGSAESAAVTVSVSDLDVAPTVTTHPANLSVTAGSDAAFAIAARGTEALSYQWRKDGVAINGANSPVLRLPAVSAGQAGAYSVAVSNGAGTALSNAATLTVSAGTAAPVAPSILTQPVSVLVNAGNTATLAVGASGSGTLGYQWLRDGQPVAGATAAFHSIAQAAVGDAGTYAVHVSNGTGPGVRSLNVVLTVNASPQPTPVSLLTQPSPQVQAPGGSATFAVAVTGSGPVGYQWLKNGVPMSGAITAVLTLGNVAGADAADYSVSVDNPLSTVTSHPARLTVLGAPLISAQPVATSASAGSSATFNVTSSGDAVRYQWTRNQVAIGGATSASHTTPTLTLSDSGAVYGVVVYNGAGIALSQGAVLTVSAAPVAGRAWQSAVLVEANNASDGTRPQVAVDTSGNAMAVWQQLDGAAMSIWANRYTPMGGWGTPVLIETLSESNAFAPQIAIDGSGNALAVWQQVDPNTGVLSVWANRYDAVSNTWSTPSALGAGMQPQIVADSSGNALAVWNLYNGSGSVWANRYTAGTGWGTAARIETGGTNSAGPPQVAVDASGNALAVWNRFDGGSRNDIWANRYTAATNTWGTAVLIETGNAGGAETPQIAVDANGNGVAVWAYFDGARYDILATHYTASTNTWGPAALSLTASASSGASPQVAFDSTGNAIAVWTQQAGTRYDLWANRYTAGTGWGTAVLIESDDTGSADDPQIAFDDSANAIVVWHQRDGTRANIWANRYTAGSGWGTAALLETNNAGDASRAQIAIQGNGNAIAVWEQSDGSRISIWAGSYR